MARKRKLKLEEPIGGSECECGEPKQWEAECCDRCKHLDGDNVSHARIIDALRLAGEPVSVQEIAGLTGITVRNILRVLKELVSLNRVQKRLGDPVSISQSMYWLGERHPDGRWEKSQLEIPGAESPVIPELDDLFGEMAWLDRKIAELRKRRRVREGEAREMMRDRFADELERDQEGRLVYRFQDGEVSLVARVQHVERVKLAPWKAPREAEGDSK